MKKTLIAMAVLAASGASFAQVTITGGYAMFFTSDTNAAGAVTDGLKTDTAAVQFSATEDLGGGLKASAKVSAGGLARGSSVGGEDAFLQLTGGFGGLKFGSTEGGIAGDIGTPGGGHGFDGSVLAGNTSSDNINYTLPAFGAMSVTVGIADKTKAANSAGEGGNDSQTGAQASQKIQLNYAGGPLSAQVKYLNFKNNEIGINYTKNSLRANVAYDLGVMSIGAGFATTQYNNTGTGQAAQIGVSAPIGALTLGAKFATNKSYDKADVSGAKSTDTKGYTLSADYALSKRTGIGASAYSWSTDNVSGNNTGYRFAIGHSF